MFARRRQCLTDKWCWSYTPVYVLSRSSMRCLISLNIQSHDVRVLVVAVVKNLFNCWSWCILHIRNVSPRGCRSFYRHNSYIKVPTLPRTFNLWYLYISSALEIIKVTFRTIMAAYVRWIPRLCECIAYSGYNLSTAIRDLDRMKLRLGFTFFHPTQGSARRSGEQDFLDLGWFENIWRPNALFRKQINNIFSRTGLSFLAFRWIIVMLLTRKLPQ